MAHGDCPHERIHTDRLFDAPDEAGTGTHYVIQKICADCGLWLGTVPVHYAEDEK